MKTIAIVLTGLLLASCSGHIVPPNMQFGKKCAETDDGQIVYSYVSVSYTHLTLPTT